MEEKKKKTLFRGKGKLILAMTAATILAFGITWAYYSSSQALANPLTTAHSGAAIVEEYDPYSSFLPGEKVTKKVAFQNTGKMDVFLRVEVHPQEGWYSKDGKPEAGLETVKVEKIWNESVWGKPSLPKDNRGNAGDVYGALETGDWSKAYSETGTDEKERWYRYYKKVLSAGETTENILESIKLSESVSNDRHPADYSDKRYVLTFNAEAVPVEDDGNGKIHVPSVWNMTVTQDNSGNLTWKQTSENPASPPDEGETQE